VNISGTIRKDPSAENQASCFVRILQNARQLWPLKGWAEVRPHYNAPTTYEITNLSVAAGDKIRFLVKHNGENRVDPIVWDPTIVFRDTNTFSATTPDSR
jgi:hypothetical protein